MNVRVRLLVRLGPVDSGSVWTVESPDVPGFYGARESLDELVTVGESAVREILREGGWTGDVTFEYEHVEDTPPLPTRGAGTGKVPAAG